MLQVECKNIAAAPVAPELIARRNKRRVEELERSNYTDVRNTDLGTGLAGNRSRTTLADDCNKGRKKSTTHVRSILLYRKNLNAIIEQEGLGSLPSHVPSYLTAAAPESATEARKLCSVCGYWGHYRCARCAEPYCDLGCKATHTDTRCERRIA
ncbi:zf-HIT domain-containing protein [Rhizoctonia solani AG-1 IA]|uniref:Zf-HIT domain-containing protein n=1 Tax=Thanatephorus cucumeris (strain AG1-IA) TaxID=983506 RepID=L8X584_THACA|nr:zf-HIT domain-containing protein [Rhizoctonia solani AG-1 IA]